MLDDALATLAASVGQTLVQAMTTDAWAMFRDRLARVASGGQAERQEELVRQFEITRRELDASKVTAEGATGLWRGRFEALFGEVPEVAQEVRNFLLTAQIQQSAPVSVDQRATGGDGARINQVGYGKIDNSERNTSFGGPLAVVSVIVVLVLGGWGAKTVVGVISNANESGAITKNSSCSSYLEATTEQRDHAVKTIGLAERATGAGNPMARLNVDSACGSSPNTRVGVIIGRQNY